MARVAWAVMVFSLGAIVFVRAQQTAPSSLPGCVYNASLPTLSDRQQTVLQCDINGKLILH